MTTLDPAPLTTEVRLSLAGSRTRDCPRDDSEFERAQILTILPCKVLSRSLALVTMTTLDPAPLNTEVTLSLGASKTRGCPRDDSEFDRAQIPLAAVKSAPER